MIFNKNRIRIFVLLIICIAIYFYNYFGFHDHLSFANLKSQKDFLNEYYENKPIEAGLLFLLIYIVSVALSFPGATILTLAGGAIFGLWQGLFLVSLASTIGATLAFLTSRLFLRDVVQSKFKSQLHKFNEGFKRDGAFYLFTLRLVPIFPFFAINLLMGLMPIRTWTYFFVSQIGMLPGTFVYVNAGTQLADIDSLQDVLSFELMMSFALIGALPILSKKIIELMRSYRFFRRFTKPKKFDYNMVVIGGGSAGLVSAYIASAVKAKVALIEKDKMGGDCLNTGCVPSKAFIKSAKVFNLFKQARDYGIDSAEIQLNFKAVMARVQNVIQKIEPHDSVERYTGLGVDCINGEAKIISPYEVSVNGRTITTKNIVVATGASPLVPPIPGLRDIQYLTSDNVWQLSELPERLVVLGGGPIGCELAQSFARLGSKVTIIEMNSRLLEREDEDVSQAVEVQFAKESVRVLTRHKAIQVNAEKNILVCESDAQKIEVGFDKILVALGRRANVRGFGLEDLGVEISERGTIVADEFMRTTNYQNIFVCGDVTGPYQFTHVAAHQAWFVAVNALFSPFKKFKVDYRVIPWCTFTDPEVARVGLNELEAQAKSIAYEVTKYGIDDLDRAIAEGEAYGFVKVITSPGRDRILGVTIVGSRAGDIIAEYVTAMKYGIGLNKILGTIHIYPTFTEANKFAAGAWKKNNAPAGALNFLARFHAWRRG